MQAPPPDKKAPPVSPVPGHRSAQDRQQRIAFAKALRSAQSRHTAHSGLSASAPDPSLSLLQSSAAAATAQLIDQFDDKPVGATEESPQSVGPMQSGTPFERSANFSFNPSLVSERAIDQDRSDQSNTWRDNPMRSSADLINWLDQHLVEILQQVSEHRSPVWRAVAYLKHSVAPRTCAEICADHHELAVNFRTANLEVHRLLLEHSLLFRHRIALTTSRLPLLSIVYDPTLGEPQQSSNAR